MTQIYFNIKNTIVLAICVFAFLFLPSSLFSQAAVVGYADGNKHVNLKYLSSFPSNAQLDRLNHVVAVGLGVNPEKIEIKDQRRRLSDKHATVSYLINFNIKKGVMK